MQDKILKFAKRLNKFTIENLEMLSEIPKSELLPVLSNLVNENKIVYKNEEYPYLKQNNEIKSYPIFKKYPVLLIDTVIRWFCEDIKIIKTSNIVNLSEDVVQKFYTIFRTLNL